LKKGIIIQSSTRSIGDTFKIVNFLKSETQFDSIDLKQYVINHFDYEFKNKEDDFNVLFKSIVIKYDIILFVTPIYWYTMSGLLKVFMDRISDFLIYEEEYGRMLRGMQMGVVSCSNEKDIFKGFDLPFKKTATYLGMDYLGNLHTYVQENILSMEVKKNIANYVMKNINIK
jgi:multimeric flavodoxin WrbA